MVVSTCSLCHQFDFYINLLVHGKRITYWEMCVVVQMDLKMLSSSLKGNWLCLLKIFCCHLQLKVIRIPCVWFSMKRRTEKFVNQQFLELVPWNLYVKVALCFQFLLSTWTHFVQAQSLSYMLYNYCVDFALNTK